jgi:hypothetical protein
MTDEPGEMGLPDEVLTSMVMPTRADVRKWLDGVTLHSFDVNWKS